MPVELKPCPFCGYKVSWGDGATETPHITEDGEEIFVIACPDCGCGLAPSDTIDDVASNWNQRANTIETGAQPNNSVSHAIAEQIRLWREQTLPKKEALFAVTDFWNWVHQRQA